MSRDTEEKKKALNRWLFDEHVLVHIATQAQGVVIPEHLRSAPTVTLKLSKHFPGRLLIEEHHIEAELRFRGVYFTCTIPFSSVWGIENIKGERKMWMAATPPELIATLVAEQIQPSKHGLTSLPGGSQGGERVAPLRIVPEAGSKPQPAPAPLKEREEIPQDTKNLQQKRKPTEKSSKSSTASLRIEKGEFQAPEQEQGTPSEKDQAKKETSKPGPRRPTLKLVR